MITASFRHIRGIGPLRERQLWQLGIGSWDAVPAGEVLSPLLDGRLRAGVAESQARLAAGDLDHFARLLPQTEHWRLLPQVLDGLACLDIEAAGDQLTVLGLHDREGFASYRGTFTGFFDRARGFSALCTFNGAVFDLPILRRVFPAWEPPLIHIDLKQVYQRLGEKGGLKELEQRLHLYRPPHLARLRGQDAAALWQAQKAGDRLALRRLVEYNLYDVLHLKPLAGLGYNRLLQRTRMPAAPLPVTDRGGLLYDLTRAVEAACP